jgi:hypothetical protein
VLVKGLTIGGTLYIRKEIHKNTWESHDLRTENQIDHIPISRSVSRSLLDVCTKRGADIGSGHHLVVASFRMKITANKKKTWRYDEETRCKEIGKCTT